jgi:hypothetical protein
MRKILIFQGGHLQHSNHSRCPRNNFVENQSLGPRGPKKKQRFIGGDDLGLFPEHLGHLGQKVLSCVVVVSLVST